MEIEYEITREDLLAFQWRAVFESPRGRRLRRLSYLGWALVVLLFLLVTALGADGFTLSPLSLYYPSRRNPTAAFKAFVDFARRQH